MGRAKEKLTAGLPQHYGVTFVIKPADTVVSGIRKIDIVKNRIPAVDTCVSTACFISGVGAVIDVSLDCSDISAVFALENLRYFLTQDNEVRKLVRCLSP